MSRQGEPLAFAPPVYLYTNTASFISGGNAENAGGTKLKGISGGTAGLGERTQFVGWISAVPSRAQCVYRGPNAPKDSLAALEEKYEKNTKTVLEQLLNTYRQQATC